MIDHRSLCIVVEYIHGDDEPWHAMCILGGETIENSRAKQRSVAIDECVYALAAEGVEVDPETGG